MIINLDEEYKQENENIKKDMEKLKEYLNIELPELNNKIEAVSEDKNTILQNLVREMNDEFGKIQEMVI